MTNKNRRTFTDEKADEVWLEQFGNVSFDEDVTGAKVTRNNHSEDGWHVDHIKPIIDGGSNDLKNLQVLDSRENEAKGDHYPTWIDTKGVSHTVILNNGKIEIKTKK